MKALIIGELKKVFTQKFVIILGVILLIVNVFSAYYKVVQYSDFWFMKKIIAPIYEMADGKIEQYSEQKLYEYLEEIQNAFDNGLKVHTFSQNKETELYLIKNVIENYNTFKSYSNIISGLKNRTQLQAKALEGKGNIYLERLNKKIDDTYHEREITRFYNRGNLNPALSYDFSSVIVLLLVVLACSSSFASEQESGMGNLLLSSINGRKKLAYAKNFSCVVFTIFTGVVFYLTDFIVFAFTVGLKSFLLPLCAVEGYEYTPLTMSVFAFLIMSAAIKIFGFVIIAILTCSFSSILNKSFAVFGSSLISVFTLMYISAFGSGGLEYFSLLNPIKLLTNRSMFKSFDVINLLGYPVERYGITLLLSFVVLILLSFLVTSLNNKGLRRAKK